MVVKNLVQALLEQLFKKISMCAQGPKSALQHHSEFNSSLLRGTCLEQIRRYLLLAEAALHILRGSLGEWL